MNVEAYKASLSLVAAATVANQGNGDWRHYGVQLFLLVLLLCAAVAVLG